MTDPTPTTEAGLRLNGYLIERNWTLTDAILAIEAESYEKGERGCGEAIDIVRGEAYRAGLILGRDDFAREAAERVRGLPLKGSRASKVAQEGAADMRERAVRAILTETER